MMRLWWSNRSRKDTLHHIARNRCPPDSRKCMLHSIEQCHSRLHAPRTHHTKSHISKKMACFYFENP